MKTQMMSLYFRIQEQLRSEEGQDLIEYALVVALIAFGAIAGMKILATDINNAFQTIGTSLTAALAYMRKRVRAGWRGTHTSFSSSYHKQWERVIFTMPSQRVS